MKPIYLFSLVLLTICLLACKPKQSSSITIEETSFSEGFEVDENSFMMKMQAEGLKNPFKGIRASNGIEEGLFPIKNSGVSTIPIKTAADNLLKAMSPSQKKRMSFDINSDEWRMWSNVDHGIYKRQGISIKEMTQNQRKLAWKLMQEALSAKGLQLSKDIMKTDHTLKEMHDNALYFDENLYYFSIMGVPSIEEPWGWQIDGHHLVINYYIMGDQVVMTPTFMGGEPIITTSGKYKGNTIFQDEQNLGLSFVNSLSSDQQNRAILSSEKKNHNAKTEAFRDNVILDYEGISGKDLNASQKNDLLFLANEYISNMTEGHAKIKMQEVKDHLEDTYFSWVGKTAEDAVFYYRIHSPVLLIEFDHQRAVGVKSDVRGATRNHIHTVVRTPNGNDYGKDLLRQHLENKHH